MIFYSYFSIQVAAPVNSPITPEISSPKPEEVGCNRQKREEKKIFFLNTEPVQLFHSQHEYLFKNSRIQFFVKRCDFNVL